MPSAPRQPRRLPRDIAERTDHDVIEFLFGKKAAAEIERLAGVSRPHEEIVSE